MAPIGPLGPDSDPAIVCAAEVGLRQAGRTITSSPGSCTPFPLEVAPATGIDDERRRIDQRRVEPPREHAPSASVVAVAVEPRHHEVAGRVRPDRRHVLPADGLLVDDELAADPGARRSEPLGEEVARLGGEMVSAHPGDDEVARGVVADQSGDAVLIALRVRVDHEIAPQAVPGRIETTGHHRVEAPVPAPASEDDHETAAGRHADGGDELVAGRVAC